MFCTAWPDAPLPRLSIAVITRSVSLRRSRMNASSQKFVARTLPQFREFARLQDPDEARLGEARFERGMNVALGSAAARAHEDRAEQSARNREQMRHEQQRDIAAERRADFLFHLRDVAMIPHLVRTEIFVDLGKQLLHRCGPRAPLVPDFASMMIDDGSISPAVSAVTARVTRRSESIRGSQPAVPREVPGDGIR